MFGFGSQSILISIIDSELDFAHKILDFFGKEPGYDLNHYPSFEDFSADFSGHKRSKKNLHIVLVSLNQEHPNSKYKDAFAVTEMIKTQYPSSEIIIYGEKDDLQTVSLAYDKGAYTFIKQNENVRLRMHNSVKGIISQKQFEKKRIDIRNAIIILGSVVLMAILLFLIYASKNRLL